MYTLLVSSSLANFILPAPTLSMLLVVYGAAQQYMPMAPYPGSQPPPNYSEPQAYPGYTNVTRKPPSPQPTRPRATSLQDLVPPAYQPARLRAMSLQPKLSPQVLHR